MNCKLVIFASRICNRLVNVFSEGLLLDGRVYARLSKLCVSNHLHVS